MKRDNDYVTSAGLPILDELRDGLRREIVRGKQQRRRRRYKSIGALAVVLIVVGAASAFLVGGGSEQARVIEIASGREGGAEWRLVLIESTFGSCLELRPRDDAGGSDTCPTDRPRLDRSVSRARIDGQLLVYGFSNPAAPPVRISASGQAEYLETNPTSPSARDPRNRGREIARSISTQPLPPKVTARRLVPSSTRAFVAAIPTGRDGTVIVEQQGSRDSDLTIRVPVVASP